MDFPSFEAELFALRVGRSVLIAPWVEGDMQGMFHFMLRAVNIPETDILADETFGDVERAKGILRAELRGLYAMGRLMLPGGPSVEQICVSTLYW